MLQAHELDINKDRRKDVLKFDAQFYTNLPIRTLRLILFFHIQLKDLIEASTKTITVFDTTLTHDVQSVQFISDLKLNQKSLLRIDSFPESYNYSIELGDKSIPEVLSLNARNKRTFSIPLPFHSTVTLIRY